MLHRIMLVDDSEGETLLFKQRLRAADFNEPLYVVHDPAEALQYLQGEGIYRDRARHPIPEILLVDLAMPEIDGYQIIRWIRSQPHLGRVFVIMLTGEMDPKRISLGYQLGANSFLAKGGTDEEFRHFVRFVRGYSGLTGAITEIAEARSQVVPLPSQIPPSGSQHQSSQGAE